MDALTRNQLSLNKVAFPLALLIISFIVFWFLQTGVGKFQGVTVAYAELIRYAGHIVAPSVASNAKPWTWQSAQVIDEILPNPAILVTEINLVLGIPFVGIDFLPLCLLFLLPDTRRLESALR